MFRKLRKVLKVVLIISLVAGVVFGVYLFVVANAATLDVTKIEKQNTTLKLYDKYGKEMEIYGYGNNVTYEDLPKNLVNAFVCTEDKNFFSHNGYDAWRILKATAKNLITLSPTKEGASTITQQLIKNTQLSSEKTIERKVQELKLAIELEGKYTKQEILTAYLNVIYFGNSIYGINNAAHRIFGKNCKDLTLSECATLAGIVKSPARYSPIRNLEKSLERRNFILSEMKKDGYISEEEMISAKNEELNLSEYDKYGHDFVSAVIDEAVRILGITENELAYGGYEIKTRYDYDLQRNMEKYYASEENIAERKNGKSSDYLALVTDNQSGLISTYCGTYNGDLRELYRQPGSTIKPFLSYLPMISAGTLHPATPVLDEKRNYDGYSPSNFQDKYIGWTNARTGIEKSINTVAVDNFEKHGIASSIEYAKRFGFGFEEKDYSLSTALGGMTYGVTPIDLLSAYMALAKGGCYKNAGFIEYLADKNGKIIYKFADKEGIQIESAENVYLMSDMLYGCVKNGTASRLYNPNYKIASKTGTVGNAFNSKYNNDIWNLSYTSENTVCVWMGNLSNGEDGALLNSSLAGIYPTEGAKYIYDVLYRDHSPTDIVRPEGIVELAYSKESYDNDHVLIFAGEFYTADEVYKDIFNIKNVKLDVNQALPNVDFSSFKVEIVKGVPRIRLETKKGIEYVIKKSSLTNNEDVVCSFVGNGETFEFFDEHAIGGCDYEYRVEANMENYAGKRVYVGSSKGIFVSVPYNFWGV